MVYRSFKRLSELRINQIRSLEIVSREADGTGCGIFCDPELNYTDKEPAFFFATVGNRAVGVLTLFLPGDGSAEISALVNPEYRRQGIFTELLKLAKDTVKKLGCDRLLIVSQPGIPAADAVLKKLKAELSSAEYKMYLPAVEASNLSTGAPQKASLIHANKKDIPDIARIDALCFDTEYEYSLSWVSSMAELKDVCIFKLVEDGKTVGTSAFVKEHGSYSLFGVGLLPEFRGRGLGRFMLAEVLRRVPENTPVTLQVSNHNAAAFALYQKFGFAVVSEQDFYIL